MDETRPSDQRDHRFLRYFAKGLLVLGPAGRNWYGFRYTPEEWQRLELYGGSVSSGANAIATPAAAIIFILIAALAVGLIFFPAMTWLYPDPAKTSAVVFLTCLFTTALRPSIGHRAKRSST